MTETTAINGDYIGYSWTGDHYPWWQVYQTGYLLPLYPSYPTVTVTTTPQVCAGEVHVFPCPHCKKCQCGKATVQR